MEGEESRYKTYIDTNDKLLANPKGLKYKAKKQKPRYLHRRKSSVFPSELLIHKWVANSVATDRASENQREPDNLLSYTQSQNALVTYR